MSRKLVAAMAKLVGREKPLLLPGRDIPWKEFFKKLYTNFTEDAVDDVAATVTYYAVLAMFPFLVFVVALVSRVVDWDTIQEIVLLVSRVMPGQVTAIVSERLTALKNAPTGSLLTIGFLLAIWSASAGVGALVPALNSAYDVVESRPFWKRRLLAIGLTLGLGVMAVAASLAIIVVPSLGRWLGEPLTTILSLLRLPVAGLIMAGVWAGLYKFLPNAQPRVHAVIPGALVGVLLWTGASWGFSKYVQHFGSYEATYGAIGGVMVLLLWMWVSAMALILGAEINNLMTPKEAAHDLVTHIDNNPVLAEEQGHTLAAHRGMEVCEVNEKGEEECHEATDSEVAATKGRPRADSVSPS